MRHARAFLAVAALLVAPSFVEATTIPYTTFAAFDLATDNLTTIDFEGLAPADFYQFYDSPPGVTASGVNFQASGPNELYVIDPDYDPPSPGDFFYPSGQYLQNNTGLSNSGILATLPGGVTAVGTDISGFPAPFPLAVILTTTAGSSVNFFPPVAGQPTYSFVGFTSDVPILSVRFLNQAGQSAVTLDNFRFGTTSATNAEPVPEPTSMLLLGTGLIGAGLRRYRQRR